MRGWVKGQVLIQEKSLFYLIHTNYLVSIFYDRPQFPEKACRSHVHRIVISIDTKAIRQRTRYLAITISLRLILFTMLCLVMPLSLSIANIYAENPSKRRQATVIPVESPSTM
jgi:hypothetical protein